MKRFLLIILCSLCCLTGYAIPQQNDYPHWNFQNKNSYKKLVKIDHFINQHKNQGNIALFDWDGTLYSETIPSKNYQPGNLRSGQSLWHIWAALHLQNINAFPQFNITNKRQAIIAHDNYLEGKTNITIDGYNKYSQIATFEAGMTPEEMATGIQHYLSTYPVSQYMYYPSMDILQHLIDSGFQVWIVTGSNPYFVSVLLKNIERHIDYTKNKKYHFHIASASFNPNTDHIIGNHAVLTLNGKFSNVYDNRYVKNKQNKRFIIDGQGKAVAIHSYIKKQSHRPIVFYAGNSGGDVAAMQYVLKHKKQAICIAINPRGTLTTLIKQHQQRIITLKIAH